MNDSNENESEFHDKLEKFYADYFSINNPEKILYHYTGYDGLIGILRSKQIWLTDYCHLNDSSEIEYSYQEIAPFMIDNLDLLTNLDQHNRFQLRDLLVRGLLSFYKVYIFSMCLRENYLPAWRWYAKDATGFALGFDFKNVCSLPPNFHSQNSFFISSARVHYDPEMLMAYLVRLFNETNNLIGELQIPSRFALSALLCYVLPALPLLKHNAFMEENEYRIFILEEGFSGAQLRVPNEMKIWSPSKLSNEKFVATVPRVKIDINSSSLTELWIGPKCNFDHAKQELELLLTENGFTNVNIRPSIIPYR